MSDFIGALALMAVVLAFFGVIGFAVWSEADMKSKCMDRGGTYVAGMCLYGVTTDAPR